jgi:hypothetical protein
MRIVRLTCIMSVLALVLLTTLSWAEIDSRAVVGIWLFDEGSGEEAKDSSGRGHNGKIIGDVLWVDGKFGTALDFPGNLTDCVQVESTPAFQITDAITLMGWIKTTEAIAADIVGKDDGSDRNYNIHVATSGKLFLNGGGRTAMPGITPINDDDWHHIAGTWDGDIAIIYVDGEEEASSTFAGPIATSDVPVKIGLRGNGEGVDRIFRGVIDEVAIFNAALSGEDIQNLMSGGLRQLAPVRPGGKMATMWGWLKSVF